MHIHLHRGDDNQSNEKAWHRSKQKIYNWNTIIFLGGMASICLLGNVPHRDAILRTIHTEMNKISINPRSLCVLNRVYACSEAEINECIILGLFTNHVWVVYHKYRIIAYIRVQIGCRPLDESQNIGKRGRWFGKLGLYQSNSCSYSGGKLC